MGDSSFHQTFCGDGLWTDGGDGASGHHRLYDHDDGDGGGYDDDHETDCVTLSAHSFEVNGILADHGHLHGQFYVFFVLAPLPLGPGSVAGADSHS